MIRTALCLTALFTLVTAIHADEQALIDPADPAQLKAMRHLDSSAEVIEHDGRTVLKVTFGHERPYPNVQFRLANGKAWNLDAFERVEFDVINLSDEAIKIGARVDNPQATGQRNAVGGAATVEPTEAGTIVVPFNRRIAMDLREQLKGMQYTPWGSQGGNIDPANVVAVQLYIQHPTRSYQVAVTGIRAAGSFDPAAVEIPDPFFPFIDEFGQYIHRDWPAKVHSDDDLVAARLAEQAEMDAHPRPASWNQYGGWADGPQLEATGHFRTAKYQGKWHLVDPDGRLFWSLGMDVVQATSAGATPITADRAHWFAHKPWEDPAFAAHRGEARARRGDYAGQTVPTFAYYAANLQRKYGADWYEAWLQATPRRLMNWGFNTIANWSDPRLYEQPALPYTAWVYINSAKLPWQQGTRNRVSDPFHPMLEQELARRARNMLKGVVDDPYCIGIFVDNELSWGDRSYLARGVVAEGEPDQPAKVAMRDWLAEKYGTINAFNAAWGLNLASFDAFLESKALPSTDAGQADLVAFNEVIVHKYFQTIRDGLKAIAPNKLYLGCRFVAYDNEQVVRIAAEYADVVSINLYRDTVGSWKPPADVDAPFIVGEFHFGATDRGTFGAGLVRAASTEDRARKFEAYVRSAASNPLIVGAHWFQMVDQPTTGRTQDSENHAIGFVSITDTPYPEMIEASKRVAEQLYRIRAGE